MAKESFRKLHLIPIQESNEPLLDIKKYCPEIFIKVWGERKQEKTFYARKSVVEKLKLVQKFLPKGYFLRVTDAYRPIKMQEKYHRKIYLRLKRKFPTYSERKIKILQNTLVYPPKLGTPPHSTGGALDVTLTKDSKIGRGIAMNNRKIPKHEQNKIFSKKVSHGIRKNREILYQAMKKASFSNYSNEWWHWSWGDRGWAMREDKKYAIYGTVPNALLPKVFTKK
jgi:D-alanyl-D-alanine dipeptidase